MLTRANVNILISTLHMWNFIPKICCRMGKISRTAQTVSSNLNFHLKCLSCKRGPKLPVLCKLSETFDPSSSSRCRFELAVNRVEDTDHVVIPVHLREKYKQSGYNHTSTTLFGQPFLIAVPRTLSEDKFYNMLLLRLWYVCLSSRQQLISCSGRE